MKSIELQKAKRWIRAHAKHCAYCGCSLLAEGIESTVDHIIPKAHGGYDSAVNLVACCKSCNLAKANKSLSEARKHINKECLLKYLKDFTDLQLPTGEHYAKAIRKLFKLKV